MTTAGSFSFVSSHVMDIDLVGFEMQGRVRDGNSHQIYSEGRITHAVRATQAAFPLPSLLSGRNRDRAIVGNTDSDPLVPNEKRPIQSS